LKEAIISQIKVALIASFIIYISWFSTNIEFLWYK